MRGNLYSAEMRLSAATKEEALFFSLLLPPLSSGLKETGILNTVQGIPMSLQISGI